MSLLLHYCSDIRLMDSDILWCHLSRPNLGGWNSLDNGLIPVCVLFFYSEMSEPPEGCYVIFCDLQSGQTERGWESGICTSGALRGVLFPIFLFQIKYRELFPCMWGGMGGAILTNSAPPPPRQFTALLIGRPELMNSHILQPFFSFVF